MDKATPNKYISPCLCFNLRRAARTATSVYDAYFRPLGLKGTQYSLMAAVKRLNQPCVGQLSRELSLEQSTATRNIELLIKKNFLKAQADPADSRRKVLALTPKGDKKLNEALPVWEEAQKGMIESLGENECRRLMQMLNRLARRLEENSEGD